MRPFHFSPQHRLQQRATSSAALSQPHSTSTAFYTSTPSGYYNAIASVAVAGRRNGGGGGGCGAAAAAADKLGGPGAGATLHAASDSSGRAGSSPLSMVDVLRIATDIAAGLRYLHDMPLLPQTRSLMLHPSKGGGQMDLPEAEFEEEGQPPGCTEAGSGAVQADSDCIMTSTIANGSSAYLQRNTHKI
jgi:hypothetical protein